MRKKTREAYETELSEQKKVIDRLRYDMVAIRAEADKAEQRVQTAERRFEIANSQLDRALGKLDLLQPLAQKIFGVPSPDRPQEHRDTERRF